MFLFCQPLQMCGRYSQTQGGKTIAQAFSLPQVPELTPRYNVAPGQDIAVIGRANARSPRQLKGLRWGLIPRWAKDHRMGHKLINARSETAATKPSFREALAKRRCLIPADGFYEWERTEAGKQPFYFHMADHSPFAFAGLWERWRSPDGEVITSCTVLTTVANALLAPIHDRMPVILSPGNYEPWLDPRLTDAQQLQPLMASYDATPMIRYAVDQQVNSPGRDDPSCLAPLAAPSEP